MSLDQPADAAEMVEATLGLTERKSDSFRVTIFAGMEWVRNTVVQPATHCAVNGDPSGTSVRMPKGLYHYLPFLTVQLRSP